MSPSVEYANGEVLLAATYRAVGSDIKLENSVSKLGRQFLRQIEQGRRPKTKIDKKGTGISVEDWKSIIQDTLRSPKQPNQSARRFLQISPLIPDASLYSLSARLSNNPWNPGELVKKLVHFGTESHEDAQDIWLQIFSALKVDAMDDAWANFLDTEFRCWRPSDCATYFSSSSQLGPDEIVENWRLDDSTTPARQFCADLRSIMKLKPELTRRQWITLIETTIRLGAASHTMWTAFYNKRVADSLLAAARGEKWDALEAGDYLDRPSLMVDQYVSGQLKGIAVDSERARLTINLLLFYLTEKYGADYTQDVLQNLERINEFAEKVSGAFDSDEMLKLTSILQGLLESEPRRFQCKTGPAKNALEFLQHSLQQRRTSETGLEAYDQGFYLAKRGEHRNARWEVALGPVAVIALVHSCTSRGVMNANMDDLVNHLRRYGFGLEQDEREKSSLVGTLRALGLVLDSPDAEGGMVLVRPFEAAT